MGASRFAGLGEKTQKEIVSRFVQTLLDNPDKAKGTLQTLKNTGYIEDKNDCDQFINALSGTVDTLSKTWEAEAAEANVNMDSSPVVKSFIEACHAYYSPDTPGSDPGKRLDTATKAFNTLYILRKGAEAEAEAAEEAAAQPVEEIEEQDDERKVDTKKNAEEDKDKKLSIPQKLVAITTEQSEEIEAKTREIHSLKTTISSLEETNRSLEETVRNQNQALRETKIQASGEIQDVTSSEQKTNKKLSQLLIQATATARKITAINGVLQDEKDILSQKLKESEEELRQSKNSNLQFHTKTTAQAEQIDNLKEALNKAQQENVALEQKTTKAVQIAEQKHQETSELNAVVIKHKKEIEELNKIKKEVETEKAKLDKLYEKQCNENVVQGSRIEVLDEALREAQVKLNAQKKEMEDLKKQLQEKQVELEKQTKDNEAVSDQKEEIEKLQRQLQQKNQEINKSAEEKTSIAREKENAEKTSDEQRKENEALQKQITDLKIQLEKQQAEAEAKAKEVKEEKQAPVPAPPPPELHLREPTPEEKEKMAKEFLEEEAAKEVKTLTELLVKRIPEWTEHQRQFPGAGIEVWDKGSSFRVPTGIGNMILLLEPKRRSDYTKKATQEDKKDSAMSTLTDIQKIKAIKKIAGQRLGVKNLFLGSTRRDKTRDFYEAVDKGEFKQLAQFEVKSDKNPKVLVPPKSKTSKPS